MRAVAIEQKQSDPMGLSRLANALTRLVMIANAGNNIVYANKCNLDLLREAEPDLKRDLRHFSADNVIGSNVDVLPIDPSHRKAMIASMKGPMRTKIRIGGRTFELQAIAIFGEAGEREGTDVG